MLVINMEHTLGKSTYRCVRKKGRAKRTPFAEHSEGLPTMKTIKVAVCGAHLAAARRLLVAPSSGQPPLAPLPQQGLPEQEEAMGGFFQTDEQSPSQKLSAFYTGFYEIQVVKMEDVC